MSAAAGEPVDRLREERNIWVTTVRADGRPHTAPVWFVHVDDRFWVGTGAGSVRVRNVRERGVATVSLEDGDHPVVADCTATVHDLERPPAVVDAFMSKFGWDVTRAEDVDVGRVVLLELAPTNWLFGLDLPVVPSR